MTLPTFLVIGAAKGGTTSLHSYLRSHPEVFLPAVKETNYFWVEAADEGRKTPRDFGAYERLFAGARGRTAVGEVCPRYLTSAGAPRKIAHELPEVRLVVSLRDPAERAWSDYLGRLRILRESRSFEEAVAPGQPCFEWGRYHARLERYFALFDRDRIHVILHDDLARDTVATMRDLYAFLGVDPTAATPPSVRHNAAATPRSAVLNRVLWPAAVAAQRLLPAGRRGTGLAERALKLTYGEPPPVSAAANEQLQERYAEDVRATAALIGRDLTHWGSWRPIQASA